MLDILLPVVFAAGLASARVGTGVRFAEPTDPDVTRAASGRAADRAGASGIGTFRVFPTDFDPFGFATGAFILVETDFEPRVTAFFFCVGDAPRREGAATGFVTDARPPESERAATRGLAALVDRGLAVREMGFTFRSPAGFAPFDDLAAGLAAGVFRPLDGRDASRELAPDVLAGALEALVFVRERVVELRDAGVMARTTAGFAPGVPDGFGAVPGLAPARAELCRVAAALAVISGARPEISTFDVTPVA